MLTMSHACGTRRTLYVAVLLFGGCYVSNDRKLDKDDATQAARSDLQDAGTIESANRYPQDTVTVDTVDRPDSAHRTNNSTATATTTELGDADADAGSQSNDASDENDESASSAVTSEFEAIEMYLIGEFAEGYSGSEVIFSLHDPNVPLGLLPWDRHPQEFISPADGHIYYALDSVLRTFEPEDIGSPESRPRSSIIAENDPVVETPPCDTDGIGPFILDHKGIPAYRCSGDDPTWYREGEPLPPCPDEGSVLRIGANDTILCDQSVIDREGTVHELSESVDAFVYRVRPEGGFWAVVERDEEYERWRIDDDGTSTLEGIYAAPPDGFRRLGGDVPSWANIDGHGAFYRRGWILPFYDSVVRFHEDFHTAEVIFTEPHDSVYELQVFELLTGP